MEGYVMTLRIYNYDADGKFQRIISAEGLRYALNRINASATTELTALTQDTSGYTIVVNDLEPKKTLAEISRGLADDCASGPDF
jgi:hypothetical protein